MSFLNGGSGAPGTFDPSVGQTVGAGGFGGGGAGGLYVNGSLNSEGGGGGGGYSGGGGGGAVDADPELFLPGAGGGGGGGDSFAEDFTAPPLVETGVGQGNGEIIFEELSTLAVPEPTGMSLLLFRCAAVVSIRAGRSVRRFLRRK